MNINFSKQETRVLQLLHEGLLSKDIAEQMQISQKTVSCYKRRIKDKLNLNDRNDYQIVTEALKDLKAWNE